MSTRSQILFKNQFTYEDDDGKEVTKIESVLTYKHHDGYVRSTVPTLRKYYQFAKSRANHLEYFVASWPYWYKRKRERWQRAREGGDYPPLEANNLPLNSDGDLRRDHFKANFDVPKMLTGLGICGSDHLHRDIEHFYIVDLNEKKIVHYNAGWPDQDNYKDFVANNEPTEVYELDVEDVKEGIES